MKRVHCLYRVSSMQQVDNNTKDIPMQRIECRRFAESKNWIITKEYEEKGISGYKVSAKDRNAMQCLKEAALNKEFDILLVYMFDRIGRIDDETPFVVEWFANHGIEVWSVKEGEQRFDSSVDRLMNYIRFWQASGESEKTSMRIKMRLKQLTEQGVFTGGHVPYGYKLVKNGKINNRGHELSDLVIDQEKANWVKWIFDKTVFEGYTPYSIANMMNQLGLQTNSGFDFQRNTIIRILQNKIYCGYLVAGRTSSPKIGELSIISEDIFDEAQKIIEQRMRNSTTDSSIAASNRSKTLLIGVAYCKHCGKRLSSTSHINKYVRKDGSVYETNKQKYVCTNRSKKTNICDGQATYQATIIDEYVLNIVKRIFNYVLDSSKKDLLKTAFQKQRELSEYDKGKVESEIDKMEEKLSRLNLEKENIKNGSSIYTLEDIDSSIEAIKKNIAIYNEITQSNDEVAIDSEIESKYKQIYEWAESFESCNFNAKRMIICKLFERVDIGKGYVIDVKINQEYSQFLDDNTMTSLIKN